MIVSAIGDSLVCGYMQIFPAGHPAAGKMDWVEDHEHAYPTLLAALLNEPNIGVAIGAASGKKIEVILPIAARLPANADIVIVNAGTNDVWEAKGDHEGDALAAAIIAFRSLVDAVRGRCKTARLVLVGLRNYPRTPFLAHRGKTYPTEGAVIAFNHAMRSLCGPGVAFVNLADRAGAEDHRLFPDGIHASPDGVAWTARAVLEALV